MWPSEGFLSEGLGERGGIRWSCLVWRLASVLGVCLGCEGVCGPGDPARLARAQRWVCDEELTPRQLTASGTP